MSAETETTLLDGAISPAENTRLFGHSEAEDFLAQSYRSGKGHHAVLIEGPEGIGKATLAFRFANHVLKYPVATEAPETISDPDPQAPAFRQIAAGASHNLLHLARPVDAKSGKLKTAITVDEVRRAGKFFGQTSGTESWRIVVIDTADELNRSAANAILKILEEPPKRSMFMVLSHAPGKLLPTIRSRCMPLVLRPLGEDDLKQALGHLGLSIAPQLERKALDAADGSVAQAIKLVNYGGLEIIEAFDSVLAARGPQQRKAIHKLADAVAAKGNDTLYGFFIDHATQHISFQARQAAVAGNVNRAFQLSELHSSLTERINTADAYNLERKQTVISLIGDLAEKL
ncbi:DNA polymerase III subunit delta' [Rhizobium sp. LjRoot254]|uniref:DNA polymerase III subunit delta' n=1 Tax=Rhizobium sp. LjRoot254 TaxID=3342297 RepID=UPI003ED0E075